MAGDNRTYSFTWTIENFSMYDIETDGTLRSPTFKAESLGGSEWFLELDLIGRNDSISLYLCKVDGEDYVDFELEIIGADNEILKSTKNINNLVDEDGKGCKEFVSIEELKKKMESWKKDILTIHCLIKKCSKSTTFQVNSSRARTKIGVDKCYFEWKVTLDDSSNLSNKKNIFMNTHTRFELALSIPSDEIEIDIGALNGALRKYVSCTISLMNRKGFEVETRNFKHWMKTNETAALNNWKLPNFLSKKMLLDRSDELLEKNTFTLKFEISAFNGEFLFEHNEKYDASSSSNDTSLDKSLVALHGDLRNIFTTRRNSDVKLRVNSRIILAHKFILMARSPVFSAMFDKDMVENQTGIVDIEDIDSKTLNSFLEYVYTGNVEGLEVESAKQLLIAADKYEVSSLVEKCSVFLELKLSVENVCEIYSLADLINRKHLKSSALDYIEANPSRVLSSKVWCDWMKTNVELANEILYKLALSYFQ